MIPDHMRESVEIWISKGHPHPRSMGSFLRSVLTHDLMSMARCADEQNAKCFHDWAVYLHNEVPALAHGSMSRLEEWHRRGGLEGMRASREVA